MIESPALAPEISEIPVFHPQPVAADEAFGELLLVGLRRSDQAIVRRWKSTAERAAALGLTRLADLTASVAQGLAARHHQLDWEARETLSAVLELVLSARLAAELLPGSEDVLVEAATQAYSHETSRDMPLL